MKHPLQTFQCSDCGSMVQSDQIDMPQLRQGSV
jgi:hypothetical protein